MSSTTTTDGSVPPAPDPSGSGSEDRRRWGWWAAVVTAFALVGVAVASMFVPVPYYTLSPGSVWPSEDLVEVEGARTYTDDPVDVAFTTVTLREATAMQAFLGWLDPNVTVIERETLLGDRTEEENREANEQAMATSQEVAAAVALTELGYDVVEGTGAEVTSVEEGTPADGVLREGDVIVGVDGEEVSLWDDVVREIGERSPGDETTFRVEREGESEPVEVPVVLASRAEFVEEETGEAPDEDHEDRGFLGVTAQTRDLELDPPFEVVIDAGDVGGPSAGLAFTLAVLDVLTPDDLTGGRLVATTGTMSFDGSVGPVGGVTQKAIAAREAGAELFLVPEAEVDEARGEAGDMEVAGVADLTDALEALDRFGGNALALGTPGDTG